MAPATHSNKIPEFQLPTRSRLRPRYASHSQTPCPQLVPSQQGHPAHTHEEAACRDHAHHHNHLLPHGSVPSTTTGPTAPAGTDSLPPVRRSLPLRFQHPAWPARILGAPTGTRRLPAGPYLQRLCGARDAAKARTRFPRPSSSPRAVSAAAQASGQSRARNAATNRGRVLDEEREDDRRASQGTQRGQDGSPEHGVTAAVSLRR